MERPDELKGVPGSLKGKPVKEEVFPGMEAVWARVEERLDAHGQRKPALPFRSIAMAAAVLLVPVIGVLLWWQIGRQQPPAQEIATHSPSTPQAPLQVSSPADDGARHMAVTPQPGFAQGETTIPKRKILKGRYAPATTPPAVALQPQAQSDLVTSPAGHVTVRGIVLDEDGNAVPGAIVKAATAGAAVFTDIEGGYTLTLPAEKEVMVSVSAPGLAREELPVKGNKGPILVRLHRAGAAPEPEAVVYRSSPLRVRERAEATPYEQYQEAFGDSLPGIRIVKGGLAERPLPGTGPSNPLIVVNGQIYNQSLNLLNPADIASVELLKKTAATSLYGARAGNGVLLIRTRNAHAARNGADSLLYAPENKSGKP